MSNYFIFWWLACGLIGSSCLWYMATIIKHHKMVITLADIFSSVTLMFGGPAIFIFVLFHKHLYKEDIIVWEQKEDKNAKMS